ncbi:MAG: hypothetical protein M1814_002257 [Vezdaea aestivalis]|nr:MAG: hypothetical protein M1814_002257 [Vezdaea aestivalis]
MQKLIQRAKFAERVASRKSAKIKRLESQAEWRQRIKEEFVRRGQQEARVKAERRRRREDYELGPLAPSRHLGEHEEEYGTAEHEMRSGKWVPRKQKRTRLHLAVKDRVVIIRGKDKGKIGVILEIDKDTEEVFVKDINIVDFAVPTAFRSISSEKFSPGEVGIPIDHVQLVCPLQGEDGKVEDVVIRHITLGKSRTEINEEGKPEKKYDRFVTGENLILPWPEKSLPEKVTHDIDTSRLDSESKTWVPTLKSPPAPPSVLDELRNRYSKFRARHEDWYVEQKESEERAKTGLNDGSSMLTPLQEIKSKVAKEKAAQGPPSITFDMWVVIGKAMAKNSKATEDEIMAYDRKIKPRPDAGKLILTQVPEEMHRKKIEPTSDAADWRPRPKTNLDEAIKKLLYEPTYTDDIDPLALDSAHALQLKSAVEKRVRRLERQLARLEA